MQEQNQERVFRINLSFLLKVCALYASIGPLVAVAFSFVGRSSRGLGLQPANLIAISMITVVFGLLMAGLLFYAHKTCRIVVREEEMTSIGLSGNSKSARWREIVKTRQRKILGFPFLLVYAENQRRPVAIPMFLQDYLKFVEAVEVRAGTDNILAIALRRLIPRRGRNRRRQLPS